MPTTASPRLTKDSPQWVLGDAAQAKLTSLLRQSGRYPVILPLYSREVNVQGVGAPLGFLGRESVVLPDLLLLGAKGWCWIDCKAKASPSWRRCSPGPRWEHGIDIVALNHYRALEDASGIPVWLVVAEERSPIDASSESPLEPQGRWLAISLRMVLGRGDRRAKAPMRGGGWYWAREDMSVINF